MIGKIFCESYSEVHKAGERSIMMALYDQIIYMELHDAEKEQEAESRVAALVSKLLSLDRKQDLERALNDATYRKQLFTEFGIA